jgi:hypothetical protein
MFKREAQTTEKPCDTEQQADAPRSSSQRAFNPDTHDKALKDIREGKDIQPSESAPVGKFMPSLAEVAGMASEDQVKAIAQHTAAVASQPQSILDLPEDVKKNIVGYEDMELDEMLLKILAIHTAATSADRIIMLLYTTYQKQPKREKVLARLRGLEKAGSVKKVEGVRSMYSLAAIA